MPVTAANPYLAGNFGPVVEEITATDLRVSGSLPGRARRPLRPQRTEPGRP